METLPEDYPHPEWSTATSTSDAIEAIVASSNQMQSEKSYEQLLYALGNNHAGTYYPVVLAVLPQLESILHSGSVWAQHAVLTVLIELTGSFVPEPGHEHYAGFPLENSVRTCIASMRSTIENVAKGGSAAAASAIELLEQI